MIITKLRNGKFNVEDVFCFGNKNIIILLILGPRLHILESKPTILKAYIFT